MAEKTVLKDYLMLHFIIMIWGFSAILGVLIQIPAVEIVFYRTLLATLILGVFLLWGNRTFCLHSVELLKILGTGAIIGLHWILFFGAARAATVSVCLAGLATCSLWTAVVDPWINKSQVKWYELLLGATVLIGLYVIFQFEWGYGLGLSMAVASAFLGALFTVINGRLTKRHSPYVITFYEMMGACLFTLVFMPWYTAYFTAEGIHWFPSKWDWFWLVLLAGFCTVYAFSVSVELMKRMTVFAINLTVNLEPVYGIILAVLIFGEEEKMSGGFYAGTAIILASVFLYPIFNYFHNRRKAKQLLRVQ